MCMRRMLIVVLTCMLAFLFRACAITYVFVQTDWRWPPDLFFVYMTVSEVAPYAIVLLLYFIPGLQAACSRMRPREDAPVGNTRYASLLESALPSPSMAA